MNETTERFLQLVDKLIESGRVKDHKDFALSVGISVSSMTEISRGRSNVGLTPVQKTVMAFPDVSAEWLITGEGEKFKAKSTENAMLSEHGEKHGKKHGERKVQKTPCFDDVKIITVDSSDGVVIPIYDVSAAAGGGAYNSDHVEQLDTIKLPAKLLHRGSSYESIKVRGQSMTPTLQDGSYVICRVLNRSEWSGIRDGYVYVIVNREGEAFIKRVKNRLKQHGFIVLTSDNPDKATYPNFQLEEPEIHRICFVEWYLSPKMPNIHDTYYNRLQEMSDDIDDLKSALQRVVKKLDEPSN